MSEAFMRHPFLLTYIRWHYSQGLGELFGVAGNFLWFVSNFFSFKLLLKTLFAPWKRLGESYTGGFNLEAFASTLIVNGLMRVVGLVTRVVVLFIGLVSYIVVSVFTLFIFVIWILAPFILLGCLVLAVTFFII